MSRKLIAFVVASAGAAAGLLLSARRRLRSSTLNALTPDINDDREADLIRRYAPVLREIAQKEHVIEAE